ncbi:MAG: hypothetical protein V4481_05125 [Patescibacteria group bacterium]
MRTPHSSCRKGKRVKVTLRSGNIMFGKFSDKKSGKIILDLEGVTDFTGFTSKVFEGKKVTIEMSNVRAFSIYKPTTKQ